MARGLREHRWSPAERAAVIAALAIVMGSLFVAAYSLALGDPVPRRIDAALVGDPAADPATVDAVQRVARGSLAFRRYASVPATLQAIDPQQVYTALDLASKRRTLCLASAAGASVARVLERVSAADPAVRVVDTHPLAAGDPSGVDIFYLMLVTTIIGFITVFQTRANAGGLPLRQWSAFVVGLAVAASLALSLIDGPLLDRLDLPVLESWGILALQLVAVASFVSLMTVVAGAGADRPQRLSDPTGDELVTARRLWALSALDMALALLAAVAPGLLARQQLGEDMRPPRRALVALASIARRAVVPSSLTREPA